MQCNKYGNDPGSSRVAGWKAEPVTGHDSVLYIFINLIRAKPFCTSFYNLVSGKLNSKGKQR